MSIEIKTRIVKEIYSNEGFNVYIGMCNNKEISITTTNFDLRNGNTTLVGEFCKFRGKESFKCLYEKFDSTSYESKINLLCSFKGIKENTAKKILDNIPNADIEIFNSKEIPKIKGVGLKTIELIREGLQFLKENGQLQELIASIGNIVHINKIYMLNTYLIENNISFETFKSDPYEILIEEIGLSFKKTDMLAIDKFNCSKYLNSRKNYITEIVVNKTCQFGNTYIDTDMFESGLLEYNLDLQSVNDLINSDDSRVVKVDDTKIQTKIMNKAEELIPLYLRDFRNKDTLTNYELNQVDSLIKEFEELEFKLEEKQIEAVKNSIKNNTSIICGGAGTGKTTIIKCILFILEKLNYKSLMLAPTGKASRRMSEATNQTAYTCHRFYYTEQTNKPNEWFNINNNILIIDEFSMVDTLLFYNVLKSASESKTKFTKLILVGDIGQLPSVGSGNVMKDLIDSKEINVIELEKSKRCKGNIIENANLVRNNENFPLTKEYDFFTHITTNNINYILKCWDYKKSNIDDLDILFDDFQICTSSNANCVTINNEIRKLMNNTPLLINFKDTGFSLNDKVMCVKNDYENNVMNGEFGRIVKFCYKYNNTIITLKTNEELQEYYNKKIYGKELQFYVYYSGLNKTVMYDLSYDELENFRLSYCCTIHKLQGSEFKNVLCDVSQFNMITDSRLLYTAITRAKEKFILLSNSNETINKIIKNRNSSKRKTLLLEKFK